MTEKQIESQWTITAKIAIAALILNILIMLYFTVAQKSKYENILINQSEQIVTIKAEIKEINMLKADKSYIDLLLQGNLEIKQAITLNNNLLIKHITGLN